GVALMTTEVRARRLALFREMLPRLSRVAILIEPHVHRSTLRDVEGAAGTMGIHIEWVEVAGREQLDSLASRLRAAQVHGVYIAEYPIIDGIAPRIATISRQQRLATVFAFRDAVDVHKILGGASPAEMPIEQADRFELIVNRKTARLLGLTVPPSILLQAEQ